MLNAERLRLKANTKPFGCFSFRAFARIRKDVQIEIREQALSVMRLALSLSPNISWTTIIVFVSDSKAY